MIDKICINCKNYYENAFTEKYSLDLMKDISLNTKNYNHFVGKCNKQVYDIVYGNHSKIVDCYSERNSVQDTDCGIDGKFYINFANERALIMKV